MTPAPGDTGYASWDETLTLKEAIEALEATLDDLTQQDTHIAYRLSSVIDEFRRGIVMLNARCDRIEAALAAAGRPLPPASAQTTLFSEDE